MDKLFYGGAGEDDHSHLLLLLVGIVIGLLLSAWWSCMKQHKLVDGFGMLTPEMKQQIVAQQRKMQRILDNVKSGGPGGPGPADVVGPDETFGELTPQMARQIVAAQKKAQAQLARVKAANSAANKLVEGASFDLQYEQPVTAARAAMFDKIPPSKQWIKSYIRDDEFDAYRQKGSSAMM